MAPRFLHRLPISIFGLMLGFCAACLAAEKITVLLADGRILRGVVDSHTDSHRLWLRRDTERVELASALPWERIVEGHIAGQVVTPDELRLWADRHRAPGRKFRDIPAGPVVVQTPVSVTNAMKPRTLIIDAILAQWDDDVQTDGVRIFVMPVNAGGTIVPVDGEIEFTLVVETDPFSGRPLPNPRRKFHELERRSQLVRRADFSHGAAVYELSFSRMHPDFALEVAPQALVHAKLGVPGTGVFEASDSQVMLREYSCFRDHLQYFTHRRYLMLESGGQPNW